MQPAVPTSPGPERRIDRMRRIKQLVDDGFGEFLPVYRALHGSYCVGIKTPDPDACAQEAANRGITMAHIYLAGENSVVCWPDVRPMPESCFFDAQGEADAKRVGVAA